MRARSDTPRGRWAREEEDARRLAVKLPGPRESRRTIDAGREAPSGRSSDIAPRREEGVGDRSTRAKVCAARQLVPGFQNAAVQPGPATFKTGARYAPDVCASPLGTDDAIPRQLDTPSRTAPRRDGRERAARRLRGPPATSATASDRVPSSKPSDGATKWQARRRRRRDRRRARLAEEALDHDPDDEDHWRETARRHAREAVRREVRRGMLAPWSDDGVGGLRIIIDLGMDPS